MFKKIIMGYLPGIFPLDINTVVEFLPL